MKTTAHQILAWALALLLCSPFVVAHAQDANKISAQEARQIAEEAYIYGYSADYHGDDPTCDDQRS